MKNLWRESHKNHWGDKVNASGHFKTGFMKKYSDPAEIVLSKRHQISEFGYVLNLRLYRLVFFLKGKYQDIRSLFLYRRPSFLVTVLRC